MTLSFIFTNNYQPLASPEPTIVFVKSQQSAPSWWLKSRCDPFTKIEGVSNRSGKKSAPITHSPGSVIVNSKLKGLLNSGCSFILVADQPQHHVP